MGVTWKIGACCAAVVAGVGLGARAESDAASLREPSLVFVPAGEFVQGGDDADEDARPARRVYVSAFFIGALEVTNEEYAVFVRETGRPSPAVRELPEVVRASGREQVFRDSAKPYTWEGPSPPPDRGRHPVVLVSYADAEAYCRWLATKTGKPYRLPTEAEWENAARGGLAGRRYPWGDALAKADANWLDDPKLRPERATTAVGSYPANGLGLFDAAGNAWEWVSDFHAPYAPGPVRDPRGPSEGAMRIVRGGAWLDSDPALLAVSHRHEVPPDTYSYSIGFRVAHGAPSTGPDSRPGFVGAVACRECHASIHTRWSGGRHSKMVQPATPASVKGDFARGAATLRGKRYGLRAEGGAFFVRESYLQSAERERRVELTLGNRRVQHYLARLDDGRLVVLPPSWDVERREWFHNMEIVDLEESSGRAVQVWSTACFGCHVSGQEKVRDPASGVVTSRWTDFGTGCERCHGPGAGHVERYRGSAAPASESGGPVAAPANASSPAARGIVRPTRLAPRESSMVCAQCHSLRDVTAAGFTAGADYFDHFLPVLEYAQKRSADPAYWGDGRPRRFSNDALGLWQSECFSKGGATCVTCHIDPHEPDVDKNPQLEKGELCAGCHEATVRDPAAHSRHLATSASCVDCHMPKTIVGVRARMRDHAIGVPAPENTSRFGIPNACNECHRDRDASWAARSVEASWPDPARRTRPVRRAASFASARAGEAAAVPGLVALAEDPTEGPVARANALGYLRHYPTDPRVAPALARALRAGDPLVRAVAALGFVDVPPSPSERAALVTAVADPLRTVRVGAALALAAQGVVRLPGPDGERLRQAQAEYAQRAGLNPDDAGALQDVGKFQLAIESWEAARAALSEAFALEPERDGLRYFLALALLRRMQVEEGRKLLREVPPGDSYHAPARTLLTRLDRND